jgi:hypothetical protein
MSTPLTKQVDAELDIIAERTEAACEQAAEGNRTNARLFTLAVIQRLTKRLADRIVKDKAN